MRINVHAGHNPDGKVACGAVGFILESTEARRVKDEVIGQLRQLGHTVYDCTCNNGTSEQDNLNRIVNACNARSVDLDVSIHFNSGAKDSVGNGKTTGTEVLIYDNTSKSKPYAEKVCASIAELGFRNRGIKIRPKFRVLKDTKAPAMLIECCFIDDKDDVQLYDYRRMAEAIVYGITGQYVESEEDKENDPVLPGEETPRGEKDSLYRVQIGAFGIKSNALTIADRVRAAGFEAIVIKS